MLIALALAACTGPAGVPDPESGLELRWQNGRGTIEAARAEAGERCDAAGRRAVFASEFMDQDETLARFYCE